MSAAEMCKGRLQIWNGTDGVPPFRFLDGVFQKNDWPAPAGLPKLGVRVHHFEEDQ